MTATIPFTKTSARAALLAGEEITTLSDRLSGFASVIHACDVSAALTYVTDSDILPHYQEKTNSCSPRHRDRTSGAKP